jgi:imidazolonepropionase-like amidohydrolase
VTAFVGVTVLPLETAVTLPDQTVVIRGDRIERVAPRAEVAIPAGARVIDGHGRYVLPGLIDAHVHLARTQDLAILLALGVTTVRNMWGAPVHLTWRDQIARGELPGPTIVTAGPILDGDPPAHPGSLIVRTAADVDQAIALHRRLGYDFVKIYSRLSPEAFERLVADAARDGLAVAGHVPWAVPLDRAVDAGMRSIEHMTGFVAALQAAGSPLAGRIDRASRAQQIDHVDEARIAALVQRVAAHRTFDVPTLGVMDADRGAAEVRDRLARPEMRWLPPWERALSAPGPNDGDDAAELDRDRRRIALLGRIVAALDRAGAPIATGTDLENPLVIPGFSLHHELELLVDAGLSPLAALRAATRSGAELLGRSHELGRVAAGMRADLVLLDANPLDDIHHTRRIAGVMARGRYLPRGELDAMLAQVAADFAGPQDPFRGAPALDTDGEPVFHGDYDITWRDVPFGAERVAVGRRGDAFDVRLESFDLHLGEVSRARWQSGAAQLGSSLTLDLDGATGRGHVEVRRDGDQLHVRGTALPGIDVAVDRPIAPDALLAPDAVLSAIVLWRPRLQALAVGQSIELREQQVGLGSEVDLADRTLRAHRLDDRGTDRAYEIAPPRGRPAQLIVDADGWPIELVRQDHGATLRLRRRPAP